jgi:hypothetical protein
MRWTGHAAGMEARKHAYKAFVRKSETKMPLVRPIYRWKNNIKMNLRKVVFVLLTHFFRLRIGAFGSLWPTR